MWAVSIAERIDTVAIITFQSPNPNNSQYELFIVENLTPEEWASLDAAFAATHGASFSADAEKKNIRCMATYTNVLALRASSIPWDNDAAFRALRMLADAIRKVSYVKIE